MTAVESGRLVAEGLFSLDPPALIGGHCAACGAWAFPAVASCAACGGDDVHATRLSQEGTIYSFTIVRVPVPAYDGPVPYGLGIVELAAEGLRVGTTLLADPIERLRIGAPVRFGLHEIGTGADSTLTYAYGMEDS